MRIKNKTPIVFIEGLDGSGKSTTAREVVRRISTDHADSMLTVADSNGLSMYQNGKVIQRRYSRIASQTAEGGPGYDDKPINTLQRLSAFVVERRLDHARAIRQSDLLVSVRDPFRIDAALLAGIYSPTLGRVSAARRLRIFDRLTRSSHADTIIHLDAPPEEVIDNVNSRTVEIRPHDTWQSLGRTALELPTIINEYGSRFGTPVMRCVGLQPDTIDIATDTVLSLMLSTASYRVLP